MSKGAYFCVGFIISVLFGIIGINMSRHAPQSAVVSSSVVAPEALVCPGDHVRRLVRDLADGEEAWCSGGVIDLDDEGRMWVCMDWEADAYGSSRLVKIVRRGDAFEVLDIESVCKWKVGRKRRGWKYLPVTKAPK